MEKEEKIYASGDVLRDDIIRLCSIPTLSGFEYRATEKIKEIYGEYFDEIRADSLGSLTLIKRCGRDDAPKIMVDTHLDEVGMMVYGVLDGGFLRMTNVGGIDPAIMQAADVVVYGKEVLRGVVTSTPPHLRSGGNQKLPSVNELLVDVGLGYTKEELEELVPVGSPICYAPNYSLLNGGYLAGKSFDNKACGAIAARAIADTPIEALAGDVYLCFSAREETARPGGAHSSTFKIQPDYAIVADVNLGDGPEVPTNHSVKLGKGVSISISAATDRTLTRMTEELYAECGIKYSLYASPSSTGTNATTVNLVGEGVPVVDIGLPLRNMHTYNEMLALNDCNSLCGAFREFICSRKIAERFRKERIVL